MTFAMQDAIELAASAEGEVILVTLRDAGHIGGVLHGYDHRYDSLHIDSGWVQRTRIENVVVVSRMERILNEFQRQRICDGGSEEVPAPDEHIAYGRKITKPTLDQQEGNPDGF